MVLWPHFRGSRTEAFGEDKGNIHMASALFELSAKFGASDKRK